MDKIIINCIEGIVLLFLALKSDIKSCKIKNRVTLTFITAGVMTNIIISGYEGLKNSLLGIVIPIILLIVLYALRMLGAGDIKLFSALGAVFGAEYILGIMAYSFIAGGIIALVLIIVRKNAKERVRHLYNYLKSMLLTLSFKPYTEFGNKEDKGKFRFAYAVFSGSLVFILCKLLVIS